MATIEQRTNAKGEKTFRAKVRIKGFPVQTASFKRKTDARIWGQNTESAIHEGRYFPQSQSKNNTVSDLIERYIDEVLPLKPKAIRAQTQQLKYWQRKIGDLALSEISPSRIIAVRNELSNGSGGKKRSPATVNRYMAALSHAFTIAMKEWEWVNENPFSRVSKLKESRGRIRFLSHNEREDILWACQQSDNEYLYTIVVLALSTGARRNEILTLKWENIDFDRQVITLHETKNGERRLLPLQGYAYELIYKLSKNINEHTQYLFPSKKTLKPIEIKRAWETSIKRAGIENFRFHDLRHSTASYLAMDGASMTDIAEVLGHKTLQMVKRYAHLSEAHTSKVVASMNEKLFSNKTNQDSKCC